jgi:hypothetical protein
VWKHWDHAWFATKNLLDERMEESFSFWNKNQLLVKNEHGVVDLFKRLCKSNLNNLYGKTLGYHRMKFDQYILMHTLLLLYLGNPIIYFTILVYFYIYVYFELYFVFVFYFLASLLFDTFSFHRL